jgi:hypothetical protein
MFVLHLHLNKIISSFDQFPRKVVPEKHIILIPSQPVFALAP